MFQTRFSIIFLLISCFLYYVSTVSIGEIYCIYEVESSSESTKILGDNFLPETKIILTINDQKETFTKNIFFQSLDVMKLNLNLMNI